jgi:RNA polymerase sigma-70 factor (ECF subfamily)
MYGGAAERATRSRTGIWATFRTKRPVPTLSLVETDLELLERLRSGDERAFAMLVARYQQPMLRLARSMVSSPSVAEEAVQDTWMGVVRGIDGFEGRSSLKTWLFRILINRTRSAGSKEHIDAPIESLHAVDANRFDDAGHWANPLDRWVEESEDRLDAALWLPALRAALDDLPPRQRQVVILRDVEGLSGDEASGLLGITVGNQRLLLHRGRSRLRGTLEAQMERD